MKEELFKEMLSHARHQEKQRHAFLSIFIAIFAAVISFYFTTENSTGNDSILLFLLVISTIGYMLTIIWNNAYFKYKYLAGIILDDIHPDYSKHFTRSKKYFF